jgi:hypothetical protein
MRFPKTYLKSDSLQFREYIGMVVMFAAATIPAIVYRLDPRDRDSSIPIEESINRRPQNNRK